MRVIDQAATDAVPRHANGRRYMPRGVYAAGIVVEKAAEEQSEQMSMWREN